MRGKILFVAGLGVGYVLGTRAGRERYEQLKRMADRAWNDPRVQHRVEQAEDFVKDKAPEVAEFVSGGAKKIVGGISGRSGSARTKKPAAKKTSSSGSAAAKKSSTGSSTSSSTKSSGSNS